MKKFILLLILAISLQATHITMPNTVFKTSGSIIDLVYKDKKIYGATDAGTVDIFDLKSKALIKQIKVDKINDFMGDLVNSKVFSVDESNGNILILSQSKKGFSRVHIYKNEKNNLILDYTKKLTIIKAKYLDQNTILLALLSNELISYDIEKGKQNYRIQVSGGKFSDFELNEDRTKVAVTDESGEVRIFKTKSGKLYKLFKGENVDNVFQISYKKNIIATAGQDRRVGIYKTTFNSSYYIQSDFLVYSVGLSPSGKKAAYASDENNNVSIFDTNTKRKLGTFGGNDLTISNIVFIDENDFLISSRNINLYTIK